MCLLPQAYAVGANFSDADMTNAVVDRVDFTKANMKGAKFINAVVTGTFFKDADLSETVWEDALIGEPNKADEDASMLDVVQRRLAVLLLPACVSLSRGSQKHLG